MNNPGIDLTIWESLKEKWGELDTNGHKVEVDFKLIVTDKCKDKTMAIDVIQKIDDEFFTETVQHVAGEGFELLGIAGLSLEQLVALYKEKLQKIHIQANMSNTYLVVSMTPTSPVSGEVKAILEERKKQQKISFQVDYQHYYLFNAIRDKMMETDGMGWKQGKAVYRNKELEFYFEY